MRITLLGPAPLYIVEPGCGGGVRGEVREVRGRCNGREEAMNGEWTLYTPTMPTMATPYHIPPALLLSAP